MTDTTDWDTVAEQAAEDNEIRRLLRAADNRAHVRRLLAERQPALAARLDEITGPIDMAVCTCPAPF